MAFEERRSSKRRSFTDCSRRITSGRTIYFCMIGGPKAWGLKANLNVSEFAVQSLLKSPTVAIRDTLCQGSCSHQSAEECTATTQLVFPYRGVYVRHLGHNQAVAEANQVLFFNATEGYRISHPVRGGDASLTLVISERLVRELAPPAFLRDTPSL